MVSDFFVFFQGNGVATRTTLSSIKNGLNSERVAQVLINYCEFYDIWICLFPEKTRGQDEIGKWILFVACLDGGEKEGEWRGVE